MSGARRDGLLMLLLGSVIFVLLGFALQNVSSTPLVDFRAMYYPARCLLQHCDPYNEEQVLRIYQVEGIYGRGDSAKEREMATRYLYLPGAFSVTLPFAMLSWGLAHTLWIALTAGSLIFGSLLIWRVGANHGPIIAGCLIGFLLANSELLIDQGMCAGIAVGFCVIAVCCFVRHRFVVAGIVCMALSLALKPQDTGLVWLYFLLAGGVYRRRALQTLLLTVVLSVPAVIWVWRVAPNWIQELHSSILVFSAHGGINDPGLSSSGAHGLAMVISLQSIISVFRDDPRVYNVGSYLVCAPLLLAWVFITLRFRRTPTRAWLALAAISALSMLPVYHREYDAKLLLLTVPAGVMLWAKGDPIGRLALLLNTLGLVLTGDLTCAVILGLINHLHPPATGLSHWILIALQVFPAPLILLLISVFYLWVYARECFHSVLEVEAEI
jgi:hypothetical protein